MKSLKCLGAILLLFAISCASDKFQTEQIPLPRSTPFDSNELARVAYLDGFRTGYRSQRGQNATSIDVLSGPNLQARELGFRAGAAQARAEMEAPQKTSE